MAGDQRRSSWPWRKLKGISSSSAKSGDKPSRSSSSLHLVSPISSFKASTESARFLENMSQEATTSVFVEDGRLLEANALRQQAEESLRALKLELSNVMREVMAKEALVKQHQKVADEAVSGWEKAEKDALSLKEDLEGAGQQRVILEDRVAHLDGALKECMRQVRHVRDEQEGKMQEAIACKTREWEQVKAELEAKQADLQRRLLESDAQNSAMVKSLQERARKILEANDSKSKAETELKVLQVKLGSSEKDVSALRYELQLLSKELEIRNEEVAFCKKSADIAHKQHLDNVQKIAKLEADCQRLRILVKKKLPGPAAIAQMRKEVEGLPQRESSSAMAEFKRRPNRSYASSTISFTNSHQRGIASSVNRDVDQLRERLFSMEEENKLLKEALSKRIGELQTSWLLCAKTASKLSMAEDQLESLQGTPRGERINGSDFDVSTTREPSIASISDGYGGKEYEEEASCAESWASALIGELAHFRKENITAKETIKEVTESYKIKQLQSLSSLEKGSAPHCKEVVLDKEECHVNAPLPDTKMQPALEIGDPLANQDGQLQALSLLCKDLDHKLAAIEEQLRTGRESNNDELSTTGNLAKESLIGLIDAAHQKFSELEKAIQGMGSTSMQSTPDHVASTAVAITPSSESGPDVEMPTPDNSAMQEMDPMALQPNSEIIGAVAESCASLCEENESRQEATILTPTMGTSTSVLTAAVAEEKQLQLDAPKLTSPPISVEDDESKISSCPLIAERDQNSDSVTELEKHELASPDRESSLGFVLCKLIALLEMMPGCATMDADCKGGKTDVDEQWEEEKKGLVACKERILVGQSSVWEFLVRVGLELEGVLDRIKKADVAQAGVPSGREGGGNKGPDDDVAGQVRELRGRLAEVEREKGKIREEREELRAEGAHLREEVARHKELQREAEAWCEELQQKQKMQGFELQQDRSAVKVPLAELPKLPKESELMEAKEKLAECERTILVLGKQLHSLSSLKQPRYSHYADMDESRSEIFALDADVDQPPPRPRGRKLSGHVVAGPQNADQSRRFAQQSGPVHVAHSQQMKVRRQRYVNAGSWQQAAEEEYSPPRSARSSPARSPARYLQQVSGGRASFVRTSLTQSLDAVYSGPVKTKLPTPAGAGGLARLFSRSHRHK